LHSIMLVSRLLMVSPDAGLPASSRPPMMVVEKS
jgi:hypothetical protein